MDSLGRVDDANRVTPHLTIANISFVREHSTAQFDHVVTVCQTDVSEYVEAEYHYFNIADGPHNAYGGDSSYELFEEAADRLSDLLADDETVLVHCHMGQSRSIGVAAASLCGLDDYTFQEALSTIEASHPQVHLGDTIREHARRYVGESS